ncbi:hypothetical protein MMC29_007481 [Sticta canariensis]|nr:hypothetical protein [Sticta canariensis]
MKIDIVPSFAKSICKRVAAGIHSFAHPNELHEFQQRERSLAIALADAHQNEEYAHYCVNKFRERGHQSEELAEHYKCLFRREHRRRAEEVCSCQNRGFEDGHEQGNMDSAYYRDRPNHNKGRADDYAARMDHERRWIVQRSDRRGHRGENSPGDIQHGDSTSDNNPQGENLHDYNLHGPREIGSPPHQPNPLEHCRRNKRRPDFRSSRKPFFPWRAEVGW